MIAQYKILPNELFGGVVFRPDLIKVPKFQYKIGESWFVDATNAGLGIIEIRPGFIQETVAALDLRRLAGVRQLPYLFLEHFTDQPTVQTGFVPFDNSRLEHSNLAAAGAVIDGTMLGFSEIELKLQIITELTHDDGTPAGGDVMKYMAQLELRNMDEDANHAEVFHRNRESWKAFKAKHHLPEDCEATITDAVNGLGLHGQLHDILDTWSYLTIDTRELFRRLNALALEAREQYSQYKAIRDLVAIGALTLWKDVERIGERLVIGHPMRLYKFLEMRARMYAHFYVHPATESLRAFMTEIAFPYLAYREAPTREQYLKWTDSTLNEKISDLLKVEKLGDSPRIFETPPTVHMFHSWREARDFALGIQETHLTVLFDHGDWPAPGKKTDKYFVPTHEYKPETFAQHLPHQDTRIAMLLLRPEKLVAVYCHELPESGIASPGLKEAYARAWEMWRKK